MFLVMGKLQRTENSPTPRKIQFLPIKKMQDLPEHLWHKSFRFYVKEDPTRVGGPNLRMIRLEPSKPSLRPAPLL